MRTKLLLEEILTRLDLIEITLEEMQKPKKETKKNVKASKKR